jgi:hypothetical protein
MSLYLVIICCIVFLFSSCGSCMPSFKEKFTGQIVENLKSLYTGGGYMNFDNSVQGYKSTRQLTSNDMSSPEFSITNPLR